MCVCYLLWSLIFSCVPQKLFLCFQPANNQESLKNESAAIQCIRLLSVSVFVLFLLESHLQGVLEQPPAKPTRGIKDVNKDNSLEKTAQQEHGQQRFKHNHVSSSVIAAESESWPRLVLLELPRGEGLGRHTSDRRCPRPLILLFSCHE